VGGCDKNHTERVKTEEMWWMELEKLPSGAKARGLEPFHRRHKCLLQREEKEVLVEECVQEAKPRSDMIELAVRIQLAVRPTRALTEACLQSGSFVAQSFNRVKA
jgi:hypothetical protein